MKKALLLLLLVAQGSIAIAQSYCANKHRIFNVPKTKTPAVVTKLGASPQFIPLRYVVNKDIYFKNLKGLAKDPRYKKEINDLFTAIGYNGVSDPAFTINKLEATTLPFGSIGMLGDGAHNYVYALLALTNQRNIACWLIKPAAGGCNLYIMNECGNAFYNANPTIERETVRYVDRPCMAKLKVKVIARYEMEEACVCDDSENDTYTETALLASEKIDNIPGANAKGEYPVKKIYIDVDKATFKRIKNYDVTGKYSKHICKDADCSDCGDSCGSKCSHSCHK